MKKNKLIKCFSTLNSISQFINDVISEIKMLWPKVNLIHGRVRHSESQGGVENLNKYVRKQLGTWMAQ